MTHFGIVTVWQTCLGWVWQTFLGIFWHCWFSTCSGTCLHSCRLKSKHFCVWTGLHCCLGTDLQLFTGFCFTTNRHSSFWTWRHSCLKKNKKKHLKYLIMSSRLWVFKNGGSWKARYLAKNQDTQRRSQHFVNNYNEWQFIKKYQKLTFKANSLSK